MKKQLLTFFVITVFIFNGVTSNVLAIERIPFDKTISPVTPYTSNGPDEGTDPPTTPSPENPTPSPEEPETPPTPVEPPNPPTSTPEEDNGENYRQYTPTAREREPEESSTINKTVDEVVKEVQDVQGDYPVTLSVKDTTLDVALTERAYTVTTNNTATTIELNNDALNTAITAATTKLNEKKQSGATTLVKAVIKVPAIDTQKITDINIRIPAQALKNMTNGSIFLNVPINKDALHLSSGLLKSDDLKSLANDDKLMLELKKGSTPKNNTYKITDTLLSSVGTPISISASTLKANGAKSTLVSFETPLEFDIALDDAVASKLKDGDQFTVCEYSSDNDNLNVMTTAYHADTKHAVFSANAPGNYILMLKTIDKGMNPLFIIIPILLIAIAGGVFAFFKLKKQKDRNLFGDYDH